MLLKYTGSEELPKVWAPTADVTDVTRKTVREISRFGVRMRRFRRVGLAGKGDGEIEMGKMCIRLDK